MSARTQKTTQRTGRRSAHALPNGSVTHPGADEDTVRLATAEARSRAAERQSMIAKAAYYRAQQRGFEPGYELEDWLAAEAEVVSLRALTAVSPSQ